MVWVDPVIKNKRQRRFALIRMLVCFIINLHPLNLKQDLETPYYPYQLLKIKFKITLFFCLTLAIVYLSISFVLGGTFASLLKKPVHEQGHVLVRNTSPKSNVNNLLRSKHNNQIIHCHYYKGLLKKKNILIKQKKLH